MNTLTTIVITPLVKNMFFNSVDFNFFLSENSYEELFTDKDNFYYCFSDRTRYSEIEPFYKRAVACFEKGDCKVLIVVDSRIISILTKKIRDYCNQHIQSFGDVEIIIDPGAEESKYIGEIVSFEDSSGSPKSSISIEEYEHLKEKMEVVYKN